MREKKTHKEYKGEALCEFSLASTYGPIKLSRYWSKVTCFRCLKKREDVKK